DPIGEAVEAGTVLLAGLVPTRAPTGGQPVTSAPGDGSDDDRAGSSGPDFHSVAAPLLELWGRLGLPDAWLADTLVTPTCGLAGAPPAWARRALGLARDATRLLAERAGQG